MGNKLPWWGFNEKKICIVIIHCFNYKWNKKENTFNITYIFWKKCIDEIHS